MSATHLSVPSLSALFGNLDLSSSSPPSANVSHYSADGSAVIDWSDRNSLSSLYTHNERTLKQWLADSGKQSSGDDSKVGSGAGAVDASERIRSADWRRSVRSYVDPFTAAASIRPTTTNTAESEKDEEDRRWREVEKREQREQEMRQNREERKEQPTKADSLTSTSTTAPQPSRVIPSSSSSSSSSLSAASARHDFRWLLSRCSSIERAGSAMTAFDLASSTLAMLQSAKSDDQLQSDLLDLLGMEGIEVVGELLQHRQELRKASIADMERVPSPQPQLQSAVYSGTSSRSGPPQLLGVSVTSQRAKDAAKAQRKEDRRMAKLTSKDTSAEFVARQQQFDAERLEEQARSLDQWRSAAVTEKSTALPAGSKRTEHKGYEEVYIPPTIPAQYEKEDLVPISSLDAWARPVFGTTTHLNRIQSKCYQAAYKHNNNLLVCAPTGAGKTNIAMLAILHELSQHIEGGVLRKGAFKIVYVAPMKALAQEVQETFQRRLGCLGLVVKELTGDMQLTKREIKETQVIVTTPEKWDVMTRKSGDGSLHSQVRLLIIDEVHLLHEDRGPVIEILVARTLRLVETSQEMCRIVGLSATLPNYKDVGNFLGVNPNTGLFFFGAEYRPVPLTQYYIGIQEKGRAKQQERMGEVCYRKVMASLKAGHQVMVFVHSRRDTVKTAKMLKEMAGTMGELDVMLPAQDGALAMAEKKIGQSRNSELIELFTCGLGVHHAGMTRPHRGLMEKFFSGGQIKVLVCTATLAWGVNLPAHTVIIKGTQLYDAQKGGYVDLGMLDVMQIFGRAGRPQFDSSGEGVLITEHDKLNHYLALFNAQLPIESQFIAALPDHLNAEIILGTVTTLSEAITWLGYTYLHVRMARNPMHYGIAHDELAMDEQLVGKRRTLLLDAIRTLMKCRMIKFDQASGQLYPTDVGRVASHYYIHHESVEMYNGLLKTFMNDEEIFHLVASSKEFQQIKIRDEELNDLEALARRYAPVKIKGGLTSTTGKANLLMQTYISNGHIDSPTLISDSYFITQSAGRITRALFEMVVKRGKSFLASRFLSLALMIDKRVWEFQHPLRQMMSSQLKLDTVMRLEAPRMMTVDHLVEMEPAEIGALIRHQTLGGVILHAVKQLPYLDMEASVQPITRSVLRMTLTLTAAFEWNDRLHGTSEPFWLWVEDADNEHIYHTEYYLLNKANYRDSHQLVFTIPIFDPVPPQYYVQCHSDRWLGSHATLAVSFQHLILPEQHPPHTALLDLHPLSKRALCDDRAESLYPRFTHFNPIQTQVFHSLYHSDENVLLGAPTGSGKCFARGTLLRLFNGDTVAVEAVLGGMELMGDDGQRRIVTPGSLVHHVPGAVDLTEDSDDEEQVEGNAGELLYRITPTWEGAEEFTVNGAHILVLVNNNKPNKKKRSRDNRWMARWWEVSTDGRMVQRTRNFSTEAQAQARVDALKAAWQPLEWEVSVVKYLAATYEARNVCKMFASKAVTFDNPQLPRLSVVLAGLLGVEPTAMQVKYMAWWLGMWVTDGVSRESNISQGGAPPPDPHHHHQIFARLHDYTRLFNEPVRQVLDQVSSAGWPVYWFRYGMRSVAGRVLQAYGLVGNKHIPRALICDLIGVRRALLAGILDGDGHYSRHDNKYEIQTKHRHVIDGFKELAATLGLRNGAVINHLCTCQQTGAQYVGYRIHLTGDMWDAVQYCAATYKQCPQPGTPGYVDKNKDSRSFGFTVTEVGEGEYFGFAVHGGVNRRFLLADYTVTHNTVVAELAMLRLWSTYPGMKAVYIAPLKALARERIEDWTREGSLQGVLGKRVVELTGDTAPDAAAIQSADLLITTPEKWDGISRNWQTKPYVRHVGLVVIDEIHLLGADRGPILEVIVSRMRYISAHTSNHIRIVGLSTALANARDLADWLGIEESGLFNFPPSVRPVPLTVHIAGFAGRHYCPRMASMNKPTYAAIMTHSPKKPVLVFVSSRRQTRLTALDLIAFSAADGNPRKFLHMSEVELEGTMALVRDPHLKHMLSFGIGMHHAGLVPADRVLVEHLYLELKIQVLVCTSTLAWGVNFPAHLVVIKGTEYFEASQKRYVDFPITDVLQMMGRAGRPQFDDVGKAVVLVEESKKNFYLNFLHSPFPVESSLASQLHNHINAEVVGGTIRSRHDAVQYITWTFLYRRLLLNPSYYGVEEATADGLNKHLHTLVGGVLEQLETAGLVVDEGGSLESTALGKIASFYYLDYKTMAVFMKYLSPSADLIAILNCLSTSAEYSELPVRHNEDKHNEILAKQCRWPVQGAWDDPHLKANLLFQCVMGRNELPISDYTGDTRSVLDQAMRVMQAMIDVCAEFGWGQTVHRVVLLMQAIIQGRWTDDSTLSNVPGCDQRNIRRWWDEGVQVLPQLMAMRADARKQTARRLGLTDKQVDEMERYLRRMPSVDMAASVRVEASEKKKRAKRVRPVHIALITEALNEEGKLRPERRTAGAGGEVEEEEEEHDEPNDDMAPGSASRSAMFHVHVTLRRTNEDSNTNILTPTFTKPKQEGWYLALVEQRTQQLLILRRVNKLPANGMPQHVTLTCPMPARGRYEYAVLLLSDSYQGLDQERRLIVQSDVDEPIDLPVPAWQLHTVDIRGGREGLDDSAAGSSEMGKGTGSRQWVEQATRGNAAGKGGEGKPFRIEYDEDDDEGQ